MHEYILTTKTNNQDLKYAEIVGLLYIIYSKDNLTNDELIRLTGIPKTILKEFKSSISGILKSPKGNNLSLNEKGLELVSQLELRPYKWSLLSHELNEEEDFIINIRNKYNLEPKREYDQFFATPKSTVEKVKMLIDKDLVQSKNIAVIGDDDLVSIALAKTCPEYQTIKVYDVDIKIVEAINTIVKDCGFKNVEAILHDVRQPFAKTEYAKFDTVLIDPPYTISGAKLFLHRSIELLRKDKNYSGKYIVLNYGTGLRNPVEATKMQGVINSYSLLIEDCINKYTRYYGADTVGSASSIYVLKTTPQTSLENQAMQNKIYTYQDVELATFPYVEQYAIKIQKVDAKTLSSKNTLMKLLGDFCRIHKLKVVDSKVTKFKKQGYSFTYILSNSNLVVHTWPENNAVHIDLITCSPVYKKDIIAEILMKLFKTDHVEVFQIQ